MNYVTYDETGKLVGSFFQQVLPEHRGNFIPVTPEERLNWNAYRANEARNGIEIAPRYALSLEDSIEVEELRLLSKIADIERATIENRGSRELNMRLLEREAAQVASLVGETRTVEQILKSIPYYVVLLSVNTEISTIRAQIRALRTPPEMTS